MKWKTEKNKFKLPMVLPGSQIQFQFHRIQPTKPNTTLELYADFPAVSCSCSMKIGWMVWIDECMVVWCILGCIFLMEKAFSPLRFYPN